MAVRSPADKPKPASSRKVASVKAKTKSTVIAKAAEKPVRRSKRAVEETGAPVVTLGAEKKFNAIWTAREKALAELFGPTTPKGKLIDAEGESLNAPAALSAGFGTLQFAPTEERMSWLYVTHGLSQRGPAAELAILCKSQDCKRAARVLWQVSEFARSGKDLVRPGELIPTDKLASAGPGLQHWIVCPPDRSLPAHLNVSGSKINLLLLMGITEAEMQSALRVRPELADGPQVLIEALRVGGIYPVTDLRRNCLTRRGDFNRLWETAFRAVRERAGR